MVVCIKCDAKTGSTYRIVCQSIVSVSKWFLQALKVLLRHSPTGHDVGIAHLPSVQLTSCNTHNHASHLISHRPAYRCTDAPWYCALTQSSLKNHTKSNVSHNFTQAISHVPAICSKVSKSRRKWNKHLQLKLL